MLLESPMNLFKREWIFNKEDPSSPPNLGVCFSGGGNRSAAFAIGVLCALHERDFLRKVDVVSAVSGGSYALSWLLLQPFYHRACVSDPRANLGQVQAEMFDVNGPFQRYLGDHDKPLGAQGWMDLLGMAAVTLVFDVALFNALRLLLLPFERRAEIAAEFNASSLARSEYREGIQETYQAFPDLGKKAPAKRGGLWQRVLAASQFLNLTGLDVSPVSFPALSAFAQRAGLPSFVFNTTVAPPRPGDGVKLKERVFELGSIGFGSDSCGYLAWEDTEKRGWEPGAKAKKGWLWKDKSTSPYATIRNFNTAPAISGAAIDATNIKQSRLRWLVKLLNLGLAYLVPNPADQRRVVRLSDGGHSENLGAYALLRRRCRTILIVDAEHDPSYKFCSYRKLKQAASQELRVELNVPCLDKILSGTGSYIGSFCADMPVMEGTTTIDGQPYGKILYLKLSMHETLLGDQAEIVKSYAERHRKFPQESTADQYFGSDRFKAYRALGYAIARSLPLDIAPNQAA